MIKGMREKKNRAFQSVSVMLLQHTQENLVKDSVLKQLWVAGLCTFDRDHILSLNYLGQSSKSAIS